MKREEMYHKSRKPGTKAKAAALALENPVKAAELANMEAKPAPLEYPQPDNRIEVSWLLEALAVIIAQVQAALADDGKISGAEAWQIGMTLLNLVWQLLSGKR